MHPLLPKIYNATPHYLQNLLISGYRYAARPFEYGKTFREYRALLEESQWWSPPELEAWQSEKLRRLVKHAYENVPAYRLRMDESRLTPADVRTTADVVKLPVVTKQQIRSDPLSFQARGLKAYRPVKLNTSGTTGAPFQFLSSRLTEAIEWALIWRHKGWGGARVWEPTIVLGGKVIVPLSQKGPPFWRRNSAEGMFWLSSFHMTPENLDLYIPVAQRSGCRFIRGYPSNLFIFAQHLARRGVKLPMKAVFTGSEPLYGYVRELLEDRFCCKVIDWYGVSERAVTSGQCERAEDYHVHMENCLVEVHDADGPAADGRPGVIVATCLSNYTMPFIRYRTGDVSALTGAACGCGRGLATIKQVQTKWEHMIRTPDRRWISPSVLTHPFKPVRGVRKSRIVQDEIDHITVYVCADDSFDAGQRDLLLDGFRERLGGEMRVEVAAVDDLPHDPSGKYRWVISNVPSEMNSIVDREYNKSVAH